MRRRRKWRAPGGGFSWLDFKLGFRMLVKYPGLTLVGGLAMAFAIWVGASTFELLTQVVRPTLPLPNGDRIVGISNWDASTGMVERQVLHDFVTWRQELESIDDLGAFRTSPRNLIADGKAGEPVPAAEMSASAFRLAGVPPLLGRVLVEDDERPGAPAVVVIGHDIWESHFGRDPDVIGRTVRLGSEPTTVVGVMPERFAFPVSHSLWVPFRLNGLDYAPRDGPAIHVFGRLAPGASLANAQAELAVLGRRATANFPDTHEHLRPQVMPYSRSILNSFIVGADVSRSDMWALVASLLMLFNLPVVLFLVLVCGNVALLMFARAATRENEIVVRNALGASRARIITQLFVEALVLGGVAAAVALAGAHFGLRWAYDTVVVELLDGLPFWFHASLSPTTIVYVLLLTVLGALVAGVVPALKVTRGVGARLRQATAGGGGFRFGGIWTAVILGQVAITMPLPVIMLAFRGEATKMRVVDAGFPAENYLSVRLGLDHETVVAVSADTSRAAFVARWRTTLQELERRLTADPAVTGVTFANRLPRMYHPGRLIEMDEGGAAPMVEPWPAYRVSSASVATDYFDVLGVPILAGRRFHSGDLEADARAVIVNESFVDRVLGGRNPIGRRLRYTEFEEDKHRSMDDQPWYEIVGVVRDLGMSRGDFDPKIGGSYHPVAPGDEWPLRMAVHVAGSAESFIPRLRSLAAGVDPNLRLDQLMPLDEVTEPEQQLYVFGFRLLLLVTSIALLLSLAGIYAVMSFTVSQRRREIGIRVALGADRRRVVAAVFRRPVSLVGIGALAGATLLVPLLFVRDVTLPLLSSSRLAFEPFTLLKNVGGLLLYVTLMMGVCMLACFVPTRRALRVEPTEALKHDA